MGERGARRQKERRRGEHGRRFGSRKGLEILLEVIRRWRVAKREGRRSGHQRT